MYEAASSIQVLLASPCSHVALTAGCSSLQWHVIWMQRVEAAGGKESISYVNMEVQASTFTRACGLKKKQKQPFSPIPELPWVLQSHKFEPLQSYFVEMKSQFKKRVIDQTMWIMHEFLRLPLERKPGGVAELSSVCPMRVTQFHRTDHLDDKIFPEA